MVYIGKKKCGVQEVGHSRRDAVSAGYGSVGAHALRPEVKEDRDRRCPGRAGRLLAYDMGSEYFEQLSRFFISRR